MKTISLPDNFDIEERAQNARQYFLDGYNCCQAVLLAFQDIFGADEETLATVASGFGGGMARMREVCGTVSAMTYVLSNLYGDEGRASVYAMIQEVAGEFRKQNGSIVCREFLGLDKNSISADGGMEKCIKIFMDIRKEMLKHVTR